MTKHIIIRAILITYLLTIFGIAGAFDASDQQQTATTGTPTIISVQDN